LFRYDPQYQRQDWMIRLNLRADLSSKGGDVLVS
jgi:hypothetical protein